MRFPGELLYLPKNSWSNYAATMQLCTHTHVMWVDIPVLKVATYMCKLDGLDINTSNLHVAQSRSIAHHANVYLWSCRYYREPLGDLVILHRC